MPLLYCFAVCLKSIEDKHDGSLSLISLIENLQFDPPIESPSDDQLTVAALPWAAVLLFKRIPSDDGKVFEARLSTRFPDGREKVSSSLTFTITENVLRLNFRVNGIFASPPGEYVIVAYLREAEEEWQQVGEYPITISHITPSAQSTE